MSIAEWIFIVWMIGVVVWAFGMPTLQESLEEEPDDSMEKDLGMMQDVLGEKGFSIFVSVGTVIYVLAWPVVILLAVVDAMKSGKQ